jgi:hypothetical protein
MSIPFTTIYVRIVKICRCGFGWGLDFIPIATPEINRIVIVMLDTT